MMVGSHGLKLDILGVVANKGWRNDGDALEGSLFGRFPLRDMY